MSGRVIRSAKSQPKPAPRSKPTAVTPETIVPIQKRHVKAHYRWTGWHVGLYHFTYALCLLALAGTATMGGLWVRKTLILAQIGESTCQTLSIADTPEGQVFWLEPDEGSNVPALKARTIAACYDAAKW